MNSVAAAAPPSRRMHRRVLAIALPAILANSSAPLVGLVDTWAIGHLPGPEHLAAIGLGSVIFNYLLWAFGFLRMGTTGLVAQAHGRDDAPALARVVLQAGALAIAIGVAMLFLQNVIIAAALQLMAAPTEVSAIAREYFDLRIWAAPATLLVYSATGVLFGQGRAGAVLALQLLLNLANAVLNLLFVIVFEMGVAGVALGTLLAQWLSALFAVWLMARNPGWALLSLAFGQAATWAMASFRALVSINAFLFVRTIFLMTALTLIMREAAGLGEVSMAATHVLNQYVMLIALGLDGFAHAAEALAGAAWGQRRRRLFQRWVRLTGFWAVAASLVYAAGFWLGGDALTAQLTSLEPVRQQMQALTPVLVALPLVSVWCFHFDGVFIGATAARAMMVTMGLAFALYLLVLGPMTQAWGLPGLWSAVLILMAVRGITQLAWYPFLLARLPVAEQQAESGTGLK